MNFDPDILRQAMRFWTTGVTIVTSAHENVQHGMTVSSFTSLSLKPPQVLIALAQNTRTHDLVNRSRIFGLTILAENQQELSDRFAGRIADELDRLDGIETFKMVTGAPLLSGGISCLDCRVVTMLGSGTHTVFVGEVLAARDLNGENPLVYFDRQYRKLQK
ncbi:MAG: flavin reductase [Chloroflexi bacterium HGW-Chloroflexi-6]|nr:MAG: flavin reductase [Chloroflexi bacterium HGW-Chloroflexi-6]